MFNFLKNVGVGGFVNNGKKYMLMLYLDYNYNCDWEYLCVKDGLFFWCNLYYIFLLLIKLMKSGCLFCLYLGIKIEKNDLFIWNNLMFKYYKRLYIYLYGVLR